MPTPLTVIAIYTREEAMALLDTDKHDIILHGHKVRTSSQRYALFRANHICVMCGRVGDTMRLETSYQNAEQKRAHFNLYDVSSIADGVMLTKDHIMPKSRGGPNHQYNYQTMCRTCQNTKGAGYPVTSRFFNPHERYTEQEIMHEEWLRTRFPAGALRRAIKKNTHRNRKH